MEKIIFIVSRPGERFVENVIVAAEEREQAKRYAAPILHGNPDNYIVDPITKHGSRTPCFC